MSWDYAYTPNIWPPILTVILLLILAIYSWRKRMRPGALPFAIGSLLAGLWVTGSVFRYASVEVDMQIFWYKFESLWQLSSITAITCFILEYTWPGRWLTRRNLILLSVIPLLDILLILTNEFHHLGWQSLVNNGILIPQLGTLGWFTFAYGAALSIPNIITLVWLFLRSPAHRWPAIIILIGQVTVRVVYLLGAADLLHSELPLDTISIGFVFLLYAIVLFGFRIFDPVSVAQQTAIQQLYTGILVLDSQERVIGVNPAAERILGMTARQLRNQSIKDLISKYSNHALPAPDGTETELNITNGRVLRHYTLSMTELKDFRQLQIGHLLMLRDVTEQKQAQAKVVEQQQAMAMLHERERLARELHDSTGQVLNYVSLQSQAIRKWMHEGETNTAEAQLTRMVKVVQEAQTDLRDSILSLHAGSLENWSFLGALRDHLTAYQNNYGIPIELILPLGVAEENFTPSVGVQLIRVIQEALANTRKHAQASNVCVSMIREDNQITIVVEDDGRGFNPEAQAIDGCNHFGLLFMRERMAQIGGSLVIQSKQEQGTKVMLHVTINEMEIEK